jgi:hypothetical protein
LDERKGAGAVAEPINLEFIAEQLKRVLTEQANMREELRGVREGVRDLSDGQTVLTEMIFRLSRDIVRVKDLLGLMDNRISKLEGPAA